MNVRYFSFLKNPCFDYYAVAVVAFVFYEFLFVNFGVKTFTWFELRFILAYAYFVNADFVIGFFVDKFLNSHSIISLFYVCIYNIHFIYQLVKTFF